MNDGYVIMVPQERMKRFRSKFLDRVSQLEYGYVKQIAEYVDEGQVGSAMVTLGVLRASIQELKEEATVFFRGEEE